MHTQNWKEKKKENQTNSTKHNNISNVRLLYIIIMNEKQKNSMVFRRWQKTLSVIRNCGKTKGITVENGRPPTRVS